MSSKKNHNKNHQKTIQELEAPVVKLDVDYSTVDTEPKKERPYGREYLKARDVMPEKQLFEFAEYHAKDAERIGYSDYSYWKSVWSNFLKKKSAVIMSLVFIALFIFTFVASAIGKYDINAVRFYMAQCYAWFLPIGADDADYCEYALNEIKKFCM